MASKHSRKDPLAKGCNRFSDGFIDTIVGKDFCHVYALMCTGPNGGDLIKIGMTTDIAGRVARFRGIKSIKVRYIAFVTMFRKDIFARLLETRLKQIFADRRMGETEWFMFDFNSAEDKAAFNNGCKAAFASHPGPSLQWAKYSISEWDRLGLIRRRHLKTQMPA